MRLVIICWEFAGAQRPRSLAESLSAMGHDVVFFTSEPGAHDSRYTVVSVPFTRAAMRMRSMVGVPPETNMAKAARARGRVAAHAMRFAARTFETLTQYPDKYRGWIPEVRSWLRANPRALEGTDVIIASSPPPSALFVGRMLARSSGARLVYDFRDLWTDNPSYPYRFARRWLDRIAERIVMAAPIAAITATGSLAETLSGRYPALPIRAVYTGIDPSPWLGQLPREPDGRLVFGHFGVWYPHRRSITSLLESLRRLADAGAIDLTRVSIQLWGDGADDETWNAVLDLGMSGVVSGCGWLDPGQVPGALARVDSALLLAWPEDTVSVALKTHGYLASGKPVLVLGAHPDSELAALLRGTVGVTLAESPDDIDAFVLEQWCAIGDGTPPVWTLDERPLPVSRESMAHELLGLLKRVAGDAERG